MRYRTLLALGAVLIAVLTACPGGSTPPPPPPAAGFALEPAFASLELPPGGEVSSFVDLKREAGFTGAVRMTFSGLPAGFSQEWTRDSANGDCSVRLSVARGVAPGTYPITLTGTTEAGAAGGVRLQSTKTLAIDVVVVPPNLSPSAFTVSASPNILEVAQGGLVTFHAKTQEGHSDPDAITLSLESAPPGMLASFAQNPVATGAGTNVQLVVASGVPTGVYTIKLKGQAGNDLSRSSLKVTVRPATDASFDLSVARPSVVLVQGKSSSSLFAPSVSHTRLFGFSAPVALSLQNLPAGVTAALSKTTLSSPNDVAAVSLTASATAAPGLYALTVKGEGGGVVKTSPITVELVIDADRPAPTNTGANALDATYGPSGNGFSFVPGPQSLRALTPLPGGKVIAVGGGQFTNGGIVARVNADGTPDASFGNGGFAQAPGFNVVAATALPDGKVAVVGTLDTSTGGEGGSGGSELRAARYNPDGSLDPSFNQDGIFNGTDSLFDGAGQGVFPASGGKLLILSQGGELLRLTPGGNLDPDFDSDGRKPLGLGFIPTGPSLLDAQGRIVVSGRNGTGPGVVARLSADGVLDPSFGTGGKAAVADLEIENASNVRPQLALDHQGRVLVASHEFGPTPTGLKVFRLTSSGALDASFGTGGKVVLEVAGQDFAASVAAQGNKVLVVGGSTQAGDFMAVRLLENGSLDPSFGAGGKFRFGFERLAANGFQNVVESFRAALALPDGRVLAAGLSGSQSTSTLALARFNP